MAEGIKALRGIIQKDFFTMLYTVVYKINRTKRAVQHENACLDFAVESRRSFAA
jgi:hypothetical protein